jgi:hypothetical protein
MPEIELTTTSSTTVVLVDEYGRIEDGRPARLKRTYGKISSKGDTTLSPPLMRDVETTSVGESKLEGEVVLFTWNAEEGEYDAAFAQGGGSDAELLDGLTEDTDLRGVLPHREVGLGDTWEVEPGVLHDVLAFGGALELDVEVESDARYVADVGASPAHQPTPDRFLGDLEGTVSAEHGGTREHAGEQVAVIQLAIAVTSTKDMTEHFRQVAEREEPGGLQVSTKLQSSVIRFEFEGDAVVLWSLDGGHLVSLEMSGDTARAIEQHLSRSMAGGDETDVESIARFSGSQSITLAVESSGAR